MALPQQDLLHDYQGLENVCRNQVSIFQSVYNVKNLLNLGSLNLIFSVLEVVENAFGWWDEVNNALQHLSCSAD